jgi:hypothetical protein
MNDSMLDLDGLIRCRRQSRFREIWRRATSNGVHAKAIVHMLDPSDTVVFSGVRTCGILVI